MRSALKRESQSGFTLVEVIAVIVITAVLGAILFQYFGTSLTQSVVPIDRLNKALQLQKTFENITEDYESSNKSTTYLDSTLRINIGAEGTDQDNSYGNYHVVTNHFIKFVSQAEALATSGDPKETLKVCLRNDVDETLTVLFTKQ